MDSRSAQSQQNVANIFSLPKNIRIDIFEQLLVKHYALFMSWLTRKVSDQPCRIRLDQSIQEPKQVSLLLTCRKFHEEGTEVLYRRHKINLVGDGEDDNFDLAMTFLTMIGSRNASLVSHLVVSFPFLETATPQETQESKFVLKETSLRMLQSLKTSCTNLRTLEHPIRADFAKELFSIRSESDLGSVEELVMEMHEIYQSMQCLNHIIIRFCSKPQDSRVEELMRGVGWLVIRDD